MKDIFNIFIDELNGYITDSTGNISGDRDLQYCFELQQKRLNDKNLKLKYEISERSNAVSGSRSDKQWSDDRYICKMQFLECDWNRVFYRGTEEIHSDESYAFIYEMITDVHNKEVVGEEPYTCPNCGAVSKIKTLEEGCEYCGTHFQMSELFPKVSNFFVTKQMGLAPEQIVGNIKKYIIISIILCSLISIIIGYTNGEGGTLTIIGGIIGGTIMGAIFGYMLASMGLIVKVITMAIKSMPMLNSVVGSQGRFVSQMKKYTSEFSYEYFTNKVVSLLKMIIFAEDARELPIYDGEPLGDMFSDVVDTAYSGAVGLVNFRVEGDYCNVIVDVFMEDTYDSGRIKISNERFRVYLKKNIVKPVNLHFSIKNIQCDSCGGSFDATKLRNCPNCGTEFKAIDKDWVVNKIRKM